MTSTLLSLVNFSGFVVEFCDRAVWCERAEMLPVCWVISRLPRGVWFGIIGSFIAPVFDILS